jgi:hypothetical protein
MGCGEELEHRPARGDVVLHSDRVTRARERTLVPGKAFNGDSGGLFVAEEHEQRLIR